MTDARALKTKDLKARTFVDDGDDGYSCIGAMPPKSTAALQLTKASAQIIQQTEKEVIMIKAGNKLASAIAKAQWRKEGERAVAVTDYFEYAFTPAHNGWHLTDCRMLWTTKVDLRAYLRLFGDFSHEDERGILPDFYLRDLTPEEIKESGLGDGAVLSVSSLVIKNMGRFYIRKPVKRDKNMRAILNDWKERDTAALQSVVRLKAKPEKNAWVVSGGLRKRG